MIANEFEYNLTKVETAKFAEALEKLGKHSKEEIAAIPPMLLNAERAALESQLETMRAEMAEYEARKVGSRTKVPFCR